MEKELILTSPFYTFKIGSGNFAISMSKVIKLLEVNDINRIPFLNNVTYGMMNINKYQLPLINMKNILGVQSGHIKTELGALVVNSFVNNKLIEIGILINSIEGVVEFKKENILPFADSSRKNNNKLISGIAKHDNNFFLLIDVEEVLSFYDIRVNENIYNYEANAERMYA